MLNEGRMLAERYEIERRIGAGGMSDVYKAMDYKLNRYVAIKVLKQEFAENESFVAKFQVEAQSAAGLAHQNIVNVYDVGHEDGIHYIVMELVDPGYTLKQCIEKKLRLSATETISIAIQVSMGIEAAHNNHIIHRDIKPQNIIISMDGKVKVTDFGIARAATSNTITSNAMGSVHYTSPEQARGGYSDEKSDIYSLGVTMFEMLTGRVPFDGETTVSIAVKHIQEPFPSPREYVDDIPVSLEQIIMKCCQKSSDRRYQNMGELIADLKHSLLEPDGDFVHVPDTAAAAATKMVSDDDVKKIKSQTDVIGLGDDAFSFRSGRPVAVNTGSMDEYVDTAPETEGIQLDDFSRNNGAYYGDSREKPAEPAADEYVKEYVRPSKRRYTDGYDTYESSGGRYEQTSYQDSYKRSYQDSYQDSYGDSYGDEYADEYGDEYVDEYGEPYEDDYGYYEEDYYSQRPAKKPSSQRTSKSSTKGGNSGQRNRQKSGSKNSPKNAPRKPKRAPEKRRNLREFDEEDDDDRLDPKMEKLMGILGIIAALVIAAIAIFVVKNVFSAMGSTSTISHDKIATKEVTMIDVSGMNIEKAKDELRKIDIQAQATYKSSPTVSKDQVIGQSIPAGEKIASGSVVELTVSSGKDGVTIPDVSGLSEAEARVKLENEGFSMRKDESASDQVEKGNVISQNPSAGESAESGSTVTVVISTGPSNNSVEVPDIRMQTQEDAKNLLTAANLTWSTIDEQYNDTVPIGLVVAQSYAPGVTVSEGTGVSFTLSKGPETSETLYRCDFTVQAPPSYNGGNALVTMSQPDTGAMLFATNTTSFPVQISLSNISGSPTAQISITYTVLNQTVIEAEDGTPVPTTTSEEKTDYQTVSLTPQTP